MEYIILNNEKKPAHKFKKKSETKTFDEVRDFDNYAAVVPHGFIVLDFDTQSDAKIMLDIIENLDLQCRVYKTERGLHVWFRANTQWKNFVKTRLAIGIFADCKSGTNADKRAYVVLKREGRERLIIRDAPTEDIQEVPRWLSPVDNPANQFQFKGMKEGDGRNQQLFNYILWLQKKGFKKPDVIDALHVVNDFVMSEPLPDSDMKALTRDEAFSKKEDEPADETPDKFKHNEFADKLIQAFQIITVNGQLYIYEDGYYQQDERSIERKMIELYPGIKQNQRMEVLGYIRIKTHVNPEDTKINPYIINLENTRLHVLTGEKLDFTPDAIEFDRIPVLYDPAARCADVDNMLSRIFIGDREVIDLFEEMVGYALMKTTRYRAGFIFYGEGHNGKSTILDMMKAFFGERNYSAIELDKLTDRFITAELENKLVNIGDDINDKTLKDTGTLKKLFTGESLLVERKGERPFELKSYAKMIFSANKIPRSLDKTEGFYSRFMFIPLNAIFLPGDPEYDPDLKEKLATQNAQSYLLNLALRGVRRLVKNKDFTRPQCVTKTLDEYKTENSSVLSWVDDENIELDFILSKPGAELYTIFLDWCKMSGIKNPTGKKHFFKELINQFNLDKTQKQRTNGKRYFVMSI